MFEPTMNIAAKTKPDKNTEFCPLLKGPTWWPSRQFLAASCSTNLMQTLWGQYATNPPIFRIILLPTCVLSLAYILSWSTWVIKIILTYLLYFSSHLADNALFFHLLLLQPRPVCKLWHKILKGSFWNNIAIFRIEKFR